MPTRVVYMLGAGFSAPLGLPVMSTFLSKSKDLYFSDPEAYSHFATVFQAIDKMSVAKNFFEADLFNIEEILSILEMESFTAGARFSDAFQKYICDTISDLTPPIEPYGPLPGNWRDFVYGRDGRWRQYGTFVGALCGFKFSRRNDDVVVAVQEPPEEVEYSVITLNYDRVLETVPEFLAEIYGLPKDAGFRRAPSKPADNRPLLAKLHGSVELGAVVPPTWSKGSHGDVVADWAAALEALRQANHIRVIGYSLPTSDAYVRYLLKAAAVGSQHLKTFDVINLDTYEDVQARYDAFINFNFYRFASSSTERYLEKLDGHRSKNPRARELEYAHEGFMREFGRARRRGGTV